MPMRLAGKPRNKPFTPDSLWESVPSDKENRGKSERKQLSGKRNVACKLQRFSVEGPLIHASMYFAG